MLYRCSPIRKNAGINLIFACTLIQTNLVFSIKKASPSQLTHNPDEMYGLIDVRVAWNTAKKEMNRKK